MGHGMAKNLLRAGHALALTVHRTANEWPTCWPPALPRRPRSPPSRGARLRVPVRHRLAAGRGGGERDARRRREGPRHRRLLDQRAWFERAPAPTLRGRGITFVDATARRTPVEAEAAGST